MKKLLLSVCFISVLLGCSNLSPSDYGNQTGINLDAYKRRLEADSVLDMRYTQMELLLQSRLLEELEFISDFGPGADSTYVRVFEEQLGHVRASKVDFYRFASSTTEIMGLQYHGGTMRSQRMNELHTEMVNRQVEVLETMISEME